MKIFVLCILAVGLFLNIRGQNSGEVDDESRLLAIKVLQYMDYLRGNGDDANEFAKAVKAFQKLSKLPETGTLDAETMGYMGKPRCGTKSKWKRLNKRYHISGAKWRNMNLNYYIQNYPSQMGLGTDEAGIRSTIKQSLDEWSEHVPLKFQEVGYVDQTDIFINFGVQQHDAFDHSNGQISGKCSTGHPGGTLAHAYYPEGGNIHFNDDILWTINHFKSVALHESGHAFGLSHSDSGDTIMYPVCRGLQKLHPDDIAGIQALYGRKFNRRHIAVPTSHGDRRDAKSPLCQTKSISAIFDYTNGYTYIAADGVLYRHNAQVLDHSYQRNVSEIWSSSNVPSSFKAVYLPHSQELLLVNGFDVYVANTRNQPIEALQFTKISIENKFGYQGKPAAVFGFEVHGVVHIVERDQVFDLDTSTFMLRQTGESIANFLKIYHGLEYLPKFSVAYSDLKSKNKAIFLFTGTSYYLAIRESEFRKYNIPLDYPKHFLTEYLHC